MPFRAGEQNRLLTLEHSHSLSLSQQNRAMALPRGGDRPTVGRLLLLFLVLLLVLRCAVAQPLWPSSDNNTRDGSGGRNNNNNNNSNYGFGTTFNPSMAIVIVILISAFFFLGFFSIYIRQCGGVRGNSLSLARAGVGSRPPRGLDLELLATFPTLAYSEVKGLKIGKGALECAVCLCEFEDDETLRLLPKCSHVFHPDCIDAWLASHITCPVCRSNLADVTTDDDDPTVEVPVPVPVPAVVEQETALPDHVAIAVAEGASEERKAELADLARIASLRRGPRFPRSHSTGHSLVQVQVQQQGDTDNNDRFTLRLPEHIRREIVAAGRMRRAESVRSFLVGGLEGSSRRGYRGDAVGEGSIRRGRSIRLGRSDRWPSFFIRNFSARMPAWASGRRGDGEGSMKKGDDWDASTKGKLSSVRAQFDCLGGGAPGGKAHLAAGDGESSTAPLSRLDFN